MSQSGSFYGSMGDRQGLGPLTIEIEQSAFAHENTGTNHTYSSFPSPVSGRSPTLPSFRIPKYGYFTLDGGSRSPTLSPVELVRPGSSADVRKNSVFRALIQSINYFVGIGVLTLPYALRTTGWFGLVLLVVFGGIMTLTAWLFGGSRRKLYLENFSDHIELAFATRGKVIVSLIFYVSMLINAGVFTKLLSDTLSSLTEYGAAPTMAATVLAFMLVTNLSTTSAAPLTRIMSVLGTLSTVLLILALIVAEILALVRYEASLDSVEAVYLHVAAQAKRVIEQVWTYTATERVYITDLKACLQTLGIFGYCYMGHEVFPAIFHHMRHPQYFTFVVSIAFSSMLLCYATIATLGYLAYGVTASGNIMDNLPPTDALTVCVKVCVIVTVLAKLTLCAAPLSEGIHEWTRLLLYLASHWLCPTNSNLRLSSAEPQTVVLPAHTPSKHSTGTTWIDKNSHSPDLHPYSLPTQMALTSQELDLNLASDRRRYFNTAYFDIEQEMHAQHGDMDLGLEEGRLDETSQLLPTRASIGAAQARVLPPLPPPTSLPKNNTTSLNNTHHLSVPPYPPVPLVPSVSTLNVTTPVHHHSHKELTWSDPLLIIPPIRSPPCGKVLASSAESPTLHAYSVQQHLTPGQALVQQEGELISKEEEASQSLGHSLTALTELFGSSSTSSSTRGGAGSTKTIPVTNIPSFKPLLSLRKPEECLARSSSANIESDSDSSSSLETVDMWYTKDEARAVETCKATDSATAKNSVVTQQYTSFDSPANRTHLSSLSQYRPHLHHPHPHLQQEQDTVVPNLMPTTAGECAIVTILPVIIRCLLPLVALAIASLFDSFVSMVIFTGGVCGGSVSIVIPTYAYYNIHYCELYTVEKLLLVAVMVVGTAIVLATILFATF